MREVLLKTSKCCSSPLRRESVIGKREEGALLFSLSFSIFFGVEKREGREGLAYC